MNNYKTIKCLIPKGLHLNKLTKHKHSTPYTNIQITKFRYIISKIAYDQYYQENLDGIQLSKKYLKSRTLYTELLLLQKLNIIQSTGKYYVGQRSKTYKINPHLLKRDENGVIQYKIEHIKDKRFINKIYKKNIEYVKKYNENLTKLRVKYNPALTELIRLHEIGEISSEALKINILNINNINNGHLFYKISKKSGRHFTNLTNIKREIRQFCYFENEENEEFIELDFANFQPFLLNEMFKIKNHNFFNQILIKHTNIKQRRQIFKYIYDNNKTYTHRLYNYLTKTGKFWDYCSHYSEIDRDTFKHDYMLFLFDKADTFRHYQNDTMKFMKNTFRQIYYKTDFIKHIINNKTFAIILQSAEAHIMITIMKKLMSDHNINILTIHDSFFINKKDTDLVKEYIIKYFEFSSLTMPHIKIN